jgi:hypothetical protein
MSQINPSLLDVASILGGGGDGGNDDVSAVYIEGAGAGGGEVRLEGSGAKGGADGAGRGSATGITCAAAAAWAGDNATWSGDAGSVGGIGMSGRGEAVAPSHGDGSIEGGEADVDIGVVSGKVRVV